MKKYSMTIFILIIISLLCSCDNSNINRKAPAISKREITPTVSQQKRNQESNNKTRTNKAKTVLNSKQKDLNHADNRNTKSYVASSSDLNTDYNNISISILGKKTISINKDRFCDDIYGTGHLDNRWSLNEIDDILDAIKGVWKIDKYIGFLDSSIYYPDLFDYTDNLDQDVKNRLIKKYEEKVKSAKKNIPNIYLSIKKYNDKDTNSNYINVNDNYLSPISIILSLDRSNDDYPVFVDQTTISSDFTVEYPTIYIKFFVKYNEKNKTVQYEPATLVLTADKKFYILIDGAFYSLINP